MLILSLGAIVTGLVAYGLALADFGRRAEFASDVGNAAFLIGIAILLLRLNLHADRIDRRDTKLDALD